jgi:hypothetical protein
LPTRREEEGLRRGLCLRGLGRDLSAVVGDTRVPRIVFPGFLRAFLETVGVKLVEPFYLVEDGFLYASASAETLASCVAEARSGKLLVKSERWKQVSAGLSPESSASLYYSLERSIPFFMRERTGLSAACGSMAADSRASPWKGMRSGWNFPPCR